MNAFATALTAATADAQLTALCAINRFVLNLGLHAMPVGNDHTTIDLFAADGDTFKGQVTIDFDGSVTYRRFVGSRWPEKFATVADWRKAFAKV